jgi:hypothetical protein
MSYYLFEKKGRHKKLGERKYSKLEIISLSNTELKFGGHVIPLNTIKNLKLCKKTGFWYQKEPRRVSIETDTGETYLFISDYVNRLYKRLSEAITDLSDGNDVQIGKESGVGAGFWQCIISIIILILIGLFYGYTRLMGSI